MARAPTDVIATTASPFNFTFCPALSKNIAHTTVIAITKGVLFVKFNMQTDEVTGNTYYFCIIADATECCAEGMEFTPADKSIQLPDIDREITVTGVFDLYEDNGYKFFHIADAVIE